MSESGPEAKSHLRILTGKKHRQIKLQRLQKVFGLLLLWAFVQQIYSL